MSGLPAVEPAFAAASGDWSQLHGDAAHTGSNPTESTLSTANVAQLGVSWTVSPWGDESDPVVADGMAYSGGDWFSQTPVGCSTAGGNCTTIGWRALMGNSGFGGTAVGGGSVYVTTDPAQLLVFAVGCGTSLAVCNPTWSATVGSSGPSAPTPVPSSPTLADGIVYVGGDDGNLYAFDGTGATNCGGSPLACSPLWTGTTQVGFRSVSAPAVANGVAYVTAGSSLFAFDIAACESDGGSCTPVWSATMAGSANSAPSVSNGMVYVGSSDGTLYAFDAAGATNCDSGSCAPIWTATTATDLSSSTPAVANGTVYVGGKDGRLYAFDAAGDCQSASCRSLWTTVLGGPIYSSPAVANGVVYVSSSDGYLAAYDAAGNLKCSDSVCSPLWRAGGIAYPSSPAVSNGVVYVASGGQSKLYAFGLDHSTSLSLSMSPASATVMPGDSRSFEADAVDPLGHTWDVTGATTFSVSGGSCTRAVCTASTPGDHTVTASAPANLSTTGTLHVFASAAGDWPQYHDDPAQQGYDSTETGVSASNIAQMGLAWRGNGDFGVNPPIVADGISYASDIWGGILSYPAQCHLNGKTCSPLWYTSSSAGTSTGPIVSAGVVYIAGDDTLAAYDARCRLDGGECSPLWTAHLQMSPTGIAESGGIIYVASYMNLYAFDATAPASQCDGVPKVCQPLWTANTSQFVRGTPAVADGIVYVTAGVAVDAFDAAGNTRCSGTPKTCTALWYGVGGMYGFQSVSVANGVVYAGSLDGMLYAFPASCGTDGLRCDPLWAGGPNSISQSINGSPAEANGTVYASFGKSLYAFDAAGTGCSISTTCPPLWTATFGSTASSPAVANGLVYISAGSKVYALDATGSANCSGSPKVCLPAWSVTVLGPTATAGSPTISGGGLYVGTAGGLAAYTVGGVTVPGSPTNVSAVAGDTSASVSWSGPVSDGGSTITKYTVTSSSGHTCPWTSGELTCTVTGLTNGTPYTFTVVATNSAGTGPASDPSAAVTPATSPTKPLSVTATPGNASATVAWTPPADNGGAPITAYTVTASDGTHTCPWTTGALTCTVAGLTNGQSYTFTVTATNSAGTGAASDQSNAVTPTAPVAPPAPVVTSTYHTFTPVRLLDTRYANGLSGKLTAGAPRTFQITGRGGASNVPAGATAVTANVTVTNAGAASSVYLGPAEIAHPPTATINFNKADNTGFGSTIALSGKGTMSVTYMAASGTTDLIVDVTGFFTPDASGDTYHTITPIRVLDTRTGNGLKKAKLKANVPAKFTLWGRGVPSSAVAVTGNLAVVNSTRYGAVYLGPYSLTKPTTATINFAKGQIRANSLTVALSNTGTLSATFIAPSGYATDLVFDVTGYYTADQSGYRFVPITPAPYLDTRVGIGLAGRFSANGPRTFGVDGIGDVPSNAAAISGIVSVYNQTGTFAIYVGPVATASPTTSALNFVVGNNCSNGVTVAVAPGVGTLSITYMGYGANTTNVEFVVTGYFVPSS